MINNPTPPSRERARQQKVRWGIVKAYCAARPGLRPNVRYGWAEAWARIEYRLEQDNA